MSTSGINNESTLMKVPKHFVNKKVATSRGKTETVQAVAPLHQAQTHHHSESFYTQCFKGVPQNLFRNHGAKFFGMVQAGAFTKMKSVTLKITIRNSGATTTMASLPYWFERLEMRSANGSKHLGTMYADNIAFNLGALLSEQQLKSVLPSANMDEDFRPSRPLLPNETKSFYLPLVGGFLDTADLYWRNIQGDFFLDFFPSSSIVSEGSGNPDCLDICLIVQTEDLDVRDNITHEKFHRNTITSSRYLDVIPLTWYNETLTANREKKLELDAVNGNVAGFVVNIKKTGSTNLNDGRHEYVNLGNDATLDLLDSGSQSLWGNGVALPAQYLKNELWVNHFENDYNKKKNFYLMPFGASMKSAYHGVVDGYVKMSGERNYIAITPSEEGVNRKFDLKLRCTRDAHTMLYASGLPQEVTGIYNMDVIEHMTMMATQVIGTIRLSFGGHTTRAINMGVTESNEYGVEPSVGSEPRQYLIPDDIKSALEELPSFRSFNGTRLTCDVVMNGTGFSTSMDFHDQPWSFTITINQPVDYPNGEKISVAETDIWIEHSYSLKKDGEIICAPYITGGVEVKVEDSDSVIWREGFETGQYDITAYALVYKHIHNYKGKLTIEQD